MSESQGAIARSHMKSLTLRSVPVERTEAEGDARVRAGRGAPGIVGRIIVAVAMVLGLTAATVGVTVAPADASTVRAGARPLQVDVLLDGVETRRAATSYWGAQSICWSVTAAAAAMSPYYGVLANLVCTSMVSVCAAQAYVAHRWAGMTFYPVGFFCWKYH